MYRPVIAGWWKQRELFDGTYDFYDLCVAHRLLDWKQQNAEGLQDWIRHHQNG